MADFRFGCHGSVVMIEPVSDEAKAWVDEKVAIESWQWMGKAFAAEPRMAADLADAIAEEGLEVEVN